MINWLWAGIYISATRDMHVCKLMQTQIEALDCKESRDLLKKPNLTELNAGIFLPKFTDT